MRDIHTAHSTWTHCIQVRLLYSLYRYIQNTTGHWWWALIYTIRIHNIIIHNIIYYYFWTDQREHNYSYVILNCINNNNALLLTQIIFYNIITLYTHNIRIFYGGVLGINHPDDSSLLCYLHNANHLTLTFKY